MKNKYQIIISVFGVMIMLSSNLTVLAGNVITNSDDDGDGLVVLLHNKISWGDK